MPVALRRPGLWLVVLVAASIALRVYAALQVPSPWMTPDEQTYAALGRSFWLTGHLAVLGQPAPYLSLAYPLLVGLPLSLHDPHTGYALAKALDAVVMSLAAVLVYRWGAALMSRWWALAAAALTLALPGLAYSGFLMTETLFLPVLVLVAWAAARALEEPSLRRQLWLLGALALAVATRLQAVVLVPAFALALVLYLAPSRRLREARRFLPLLGLLAALTAAWLAVSLGRGRSPLGAYGVVSGGSYSPGEVLKYAVFHLADLILLTAVVPAVALVLLLLDARRSARPAGERAFLAVTVAFALALVAEVGLFTSRNLGRLGERYLIGLAPLLFLAFALWLAHGAPRPRGTAVVVGAAALGLLAVLPERLFAKEAQPEAFTVIPLHHLAAWAGGGARWFLVGVGAGLVLVLVALPRRSLPWLAGLVGVLLVAVSVYASRVVAREASAFAKTTAGLQPTWIAESVAGPVALVYAGELGWTGGAPVWAATFWNRNVDRVYVLGGATVYGPMPVTRASLVDGKVVVDGAVAPETALVTGVSTRLANGNATPSPDRSWLLWSLVGPQSG